MSTRPNGRVDAGVLAVSLVLATIAVGVFALWPQTPARAQGIIIPNTFALHTAADPAQVNANFAALAANALNRNGGTLGGTLNLNGQTLSGNATFTGAITFSTVPSGINAVPSGLAFLNTGYVSGPPCPSGYSEVAALRGYYAVGLVSGGTPGTAVGTPLTDLENRPVGQHNHTGSTSLTDTRTWRVNDGGAAGGDDVSAQTALGASPNTFTTGPKVGLSGGSLSGTITVNNSTGGGGVPGTPAPFKQYPWCQKN